MSATPPEARDEYSRGSPRHSRVSGARRGRYLPRTVNRETLAKGVGGLVLAGGLLGSLLLLVAEFTTLFYVRVATSSGPATIKTVTTGSHHTYALIPIAVVAAVLAFAVFRFASRPALLAIGALGIVTLLIALVGDLPDAQSTGLVRAPGTQYVNATSSPSAGLYMETLGAAVLVITCGAGLLLLAPQGPSPQRPPEPQGPSPQRPPERQGPSPRRPPER